MALLGRLLILFEFEGVGEAKRVIHLGVKWFDGKSLFLWWNPSIGCLKEDRDKSEVWVRIIGPLVSFGESFF